MANGQPLIHVLERLVVVTDSVVNEREIVERVAKAGDIIERFPNRKRFRVTLDRSFVVAAVIGDQPEPVIGRGQSLAIAGLLADIQVCPSSGIRGIEVALIEGHVAEMLKRRGA